MFFRPYFQLGVESLWFPFDVILIYLIPFDFFDFCWFCWFLSIPVDFFDFQFVFSWNGAYIIHLKKSFYFSCLKSVDTSSNNPIKACKKAKIVLRNFLKNQQNIQSAIFKCTEIFENFFFENFTVSFSLKSILNWQFFFLNFGFSNLLISTIFSALYQLF